MRMILLGICLLLGGCVTAEERLAQDDRACQSYGMVKGSPAYQNCRMQLENNRAAVRASERFGADSCAVCNLKRMLEN